jgi:hypothetical protein
VTGRRTPAARPNAGDWQVVVYETPSGKHPALEYLGAASVPDQPRRELLLTVFAVARMGPLNFPTGTTRWRLMHKPAKKGDVDMSGIFEARDQHNRVLYRLFCVLDRDLPKHGPSIVLLGGGTKPGRTEMPQRVYRTIDNHRHDYLKTRRIASLKTWPEWWPRPRVN